ncbi:WDR49 protein, partial [Atractosteus spatula]|nr:WDR49 protein [Atractosteus spatula]
MCATRDWDSGIWEIYEKEIPVTITGFDQEQNVGLEEELQLEHLQWLKEAFASHVPRDPRPGEGGAGWKDEKGWRSSRGPKQQAGSMSLEEFQSALGTMLGSERWASQMELLFNKVDTSCDGYVDWEEFCTYLLLQYKEKDYTGRQRETFLSTQPVIRHCLYNKVTLPLRFLSVSKEGTLTIWDSNLRILKSQEVSLESSEIAGSRSRIRKWTTDAVCMSDVHKIALATTSRDIHFFDISTASCFEEFYLFGIANVPTCLCYWYDTKAPGSPSVLLWGDDAGNVNVLWFLHPHSGMFETPFTEEKGPQRVFMQDIRDHIRLVSYQLIPGVHREAICRICYERSGDLIITSSGSSSTSVVIMDAHRKKKSYTWKINKGVTCFDFCKSLNLLVTGGVDHTVRLWNQYVTSRPVATLQGHYMAVLDVVIYEPLGQIFSYSKDAVLKVWDISSLCCLRTLLLKFPCVQAGHAVEHGDFPFLLLTSAPHVLLVSCGDYLALLRLQSGGAEGDRLLTHSAPLSCALYNPFFKQVVTGSDDSTVAVWDVETGTKCLQLSNVHGQEEITCMALDSTQRRLITGARNGTIKVWNIQNGHNLHKLEAIAEAEVTGVICFQDNKLLTVGWSRKLALYSITDPGKTYVHADLSWKGGQVHSDDILAVDYCPSLGLLATASFDGELIVWTLDTQRSFVYLRRAPHTAGKVKSKDTAPCSLSQPPILSIFMVQPPVDKLLFLKFRAEDRKCRNGPLLISSEAGFLCWWSVMGSPRKHGQFYAPKRTDESVLGLCTDQENMLLMSGDTAGFIQVWDISEFGLQPGDKAVNGCPPLLYCWRAHDSTVVSMELLLFGSQLFLVSASSDQTARLWSCNGCYVGTFGQKKKWNLKNPSTYQHPRDPWRDTREIEKEEEEEEKTGVRQQSVSGLSPSKEQRLIQDEASGQSFTQSFISSLDSREAESPASGLLDNPAKAPHTKSALGVQVEQGLLRKTVARLERRLAFGDIDSRKLACVGSVCTPFQALATPECQELQLPCDLPMSPWMLSKGLKCVNEADLKSLPLTSRSSDNDQCEDPDRTIVRSRLPLD